MPQPLLLLRETGLYPLLLGPAAVVGRHDALQMLGFFRHHADKR